MMDDMKMINNPKISKFSPKIINESVPKHSGLLLALLTF